MMEILTAGLVIGITGLCIGLLLGIAGKKFVVEEDEKEAKIRELLPGSNCGGCGYAGCDALAKAIVSGEAPANACPGCSEENAAKIGEILGISIEKNTRMIANVSCAGTCSKTENQYEYYGISDCQKLALIPGRGEKACDYGCMGLGSCVRACPFDAIHIADGIAKVDKEACKACGQCIDICPNNLIEMVPYDSKYQVLCHSKAKGKEVKAVCQVGCIGCGICAKQCEDEAITLTDNIATIDGLKCTGCGKCAVKCPVKIIRMV